MAEARIHRRLAAIMAADVVGYSRLMAGDEAGTLAALKRHREAVFDPAVAAHGGRIVKLIGDGTLVEFGSVVDAVTCAVAIQRAVAAEAGAIVLRIGINLGDIIIEGDDIYGDGVNVAARLEPLAAPGGVCVAAIVKDSVGTRIDVPFKDGGEVQVKNIERPIRVWKWHPENAAATPVAAAAERVVVPALAVLPFQNMSGDAEQEYFADGMVEDLTTALSRFRSFAVISRNSAFVYKGRPIDVRQAARELGCRYIVEGSVRRAGNRLRLTAQLIEGVSGAHLWANNFDGAVADVFDMQDRITESVVSVVEPKIQQAEIERSRRERPESLGAYDLYLRALQKLNTYLPDENAAALALLEQAIALEPRYAVALAAAVFGYEHRSTAGWPPLTADDRERCLHHVRAALALDSDDAMVLTRCGIALQIVGRDFDRGLTILKRAVELNPNNAQVLHNAGVGHIFGGSLDEAMPLFQRSLKLSPGASVTPKTGIAHVHLCRGEYGAALDWAGQSLAENANLNITHWILISAYAHLGRLDEARRALAALKAISPDATLASIRRGHQTKDPHRFEVMVDGLRMAGMAEAQAGAESL